MTSVPALRGPPRPPLTYFKNVPGLLAENLKVPGKPVATLSTAT
jgi:hypothetical protein